MRGLVGRVRDQKLSERPF